MAFLEIPALVQDVVWLLVHVWSDIKIGLNSLHKATILDLLAKEVASKALTPAMACQAAFLLVE